MYANVCVESNTIDNIVLFLMNNHKIIASTWHINNISINRIIERYKKKGKKDKIKTLNMENVRLS